MASMAGDKAGKFILRVSLGVIILLHGIAKLKGGIDPITGMVTAQGLPAFLAYGVYVGEVLAPVMLIAGFYARIGGALVAINMLFALFLVHRADLLVINPQSGGWAVEFQVLMLCAAITVMLIGPGKAGINEK
ncbi:MAG: GntR family transcriptional regulator [Gammaproteobacteria bacterium RIFCSPHIGHO2_12_FULL_63_22]|nr:MAG: GntR family transcriptional regulator [Gammaproteobacteria bacterium RIFCSPHIGHO2_12_FULL_63_22]